METKIDEIAPDIFRLSTLVPEVAPGGFSFNQFLVRDEQPFLFHTGMRQLYPLVSAAVVAARAARRPAVDLLRPRRGRRVRRHEPVPGRRARRPRSCTASWPCMVSLNDLADRPPRAIDDGRGARPRHPPPAVHPHPARAPRLGERPVVRRDHRAPCSPATSSPRSVTDPPSPRTTSSTRPSSAEELFHSTSCGPNLVPTLDALADLEPTTLAVDARLVVPRRRRHPAPGPGRRLRGEHGRRAALVPNEPPKSRSGSPSTSGVDKDRHHDQAPSTRRAVRHGRSRRRGRQPRALGGERQPRRHPGRRAPRRAGFGLLGGHAQLPGPRRLPHHPVRPAQLRAQHAAGQRPRRRPVHQHDRSPAQRHGAAPRAPGDRSLGAARLLVGLHPRPGVRGVPTGTRARGSWRWG